MSRVDLLQLGDESGVSLSLSLVAPLAVRLAPAAGLSAGSLATEVRRQLRLYGAAPAGGARLCSRGAWRTSL